MREGTPEPPSAKGAAGSAESPAPEIGSLDHRALEEAVQYVLADCFFAVGQTVGMRMTVDYEAVVWWHDHFREKFLAALHRHGNRWLRDRESVTAVGWMLAERAVRHAGGGGSIDIQAARQAAADVERYCRVRSARAQRRGDGKEVDHTRQAGYWCISFPY